MENETPEYEAHIDRVHEVERQISCAKSLLLFITFIFDIISMESHFSSFEWSCFSHLFSIFYLEARTQFLGHAMNNGGKMESSASVRLHKTTNICWCSLHYCTMYMLLVLFIFSLFPTNSCCF